MKLVRYRTPIAVTITVVIGISSCLLISHIRTHMSAIKRLTDAGATITSFWSFDNAGSTNRPPMTSSNALIRMFVSEPRGILVNAQTTVDAVRELDTLLAIDRVVFDRVDFSVAQNDNLLKLMLERRQIVNLAFVSCDHLSASTIRSVSIDHVTMISIIEQNGGEPKQPIDLSFAAQFRHLSCLQVIGGLVNAAELSQVSTLSYLVDCRFAFCRLQTGAISEIAGLATLKRMSLWKVEAIDFDIEMLKGLSNLQELELEGIPLSENGVKNIARELPQLKELRLPSVWSEDQLRAVSRTCPDVVLSRCGGRFSDSYFAKEPIVVRHEMRPDLRSSSSTSEDNEGP